MVVFLFLFIKIIFHAIQLTLCIMFFLIDFPLTVLTLTNLTWIFICFLLGINLGAKHARNTPGCYKPTPLKRISSQDSEQDSEKGKLDSLLRSEITSEVTRHRKLKHSEIKRPHSYKQLGCAHNLSRNRWKRGQWKSKRKTIIQNHGVYPVDPETREWELEHREP
jgi:hypothetical protein